MRRPKFGDVLRWDGTADKGHLVMFIRLGKKTGNFIGISLVHGNGRTDFVRDVNENYGPLHQSKGHGAWRLHE